MNELQLPLLKLTHIIVKKIINIDVILIQSDSCKFNHTNYFIIQLKC
jgi:hypothetical protein